jgi:hypothetical protein
VELAIGYRVVGRTLEQPDPDEAFVSGDTVVAWTSVGGLPSGFIEHVWYRDDVEVARHYLPVGAGRRWRTWTRHKVGAGEYTVQVLGPDGRLLRESKFVVTDPEGC